ncbi:cryptochrome/photolyase family protein [Bizionia argentinensis JUB59]|uniref:Cryptochrome/photolyase family protein n=1 Tax=Bizionia argentinensis JUB59 TaxID=1046627 RepID=G2ECG7_9FLAO|nr:cryptochrome/photolyase family protein [Bizionia argentinensis]EGV43841.1 cryptochrome/photolyase family protein [Bizionia argentinensis JUB59]
MKTLRLILGDQLNIKHPWFKAVDDDVLYVLFEMRQETDYVTHHIQKVIGFFAAMRQFASDLETAGHQVIYYKITDEKNTQNLIENLKNIIKDKNISTFEYLYPDEYRLDKQLEDFSKTLSIETNVMDTAHFYTKRNDLQTFYTGKKQFVMESFYRDMRKKHDILMVYGNPEGGKWNYDKSNRKKWKNEPVIPSYKYFKNNVDAVVADMKSAGISTMGNWDLKTFNYPISRKQALSQLAYFCKNLLKHFGDYQDAMHTDEVYLFHSRISFAMNIKLISARNVVDTVINYYRKHEENIDISQVEGFIRQVIGWREYMRGMYWAFMPEFKAENYLNNKNKLADFFWTGNTKMACLKHAITNSLDNAYAHHIQRLMITGNYALLTQTDPDAVDAWYLGIYADAVEWVQLPNTRGMSQFSDGGKIATKPYVSSGSYIQKTGNYCEGCHYDHKKKTEDDACPFNSLYWNFLDDKREQLESNFRMKMMYSLLNKMDNEKLSALKERANHIINNQDAY